MNRYRLLRLFLGICVVGAAVAASQARATSIASDQLVLEIDSVTENGVEISDLDAYRPGHVEVIGAFGQAKLRAYANSQPRVLKLVGLYEGR